MELRARPLPSRRRVAMMAGLAALLAPVATGAAPVADAATKHSTAARDRTPVVTAIRPSRLEVGDVLEIHGVRFLRGRNRNTVVFRRDGARAVFAKAQLGTAKLLKVKVPATLAPFLTQRAGKPVPTRFRLRVFSARLGRHFTSNKLSPLVAPDTPPPPPVPAEVLETGDCDQDGAVNARDVDDDNDGVTDQDEAAYGLDKCKADTDGDGVTDKWAIDCDHDGIRNREDGDDDDDLLADPVEEKYGLNTCKPDTDGDGVDDGFEFRSAQDLNDDEYQNPNIFLPYPGGRPYANPLDSKDAGIDHDGDTLTLAQEYALWQYTQTRYGAPRDLNQLTYSDGEQYSIFTRDADGRRVPGPDAANYDRQQQFLAWAASAPAQSDYAGGGYLTVLISDPDKDWFAGRRSVDIRDLDRNGVVSAAEQAYLDRDGNGRLSDAERDEDADGLSNVQETSTCMNRTYWSKLYKKETPYYREYAGTNLADEDSDDDGVRDGADDQDADDLPNIMECSRSMAGWAIDNIENTDQNNTAEDTLEVQVQDGRPLKTFLNPFNPCLPSVKARTCNRYPTFGSEWAPFNDGDVYWYILN